MVDSTSHRLDLYTLYYTLDRILGIDELSLWMPLHIIPLKLMQKFLEGDQKYNLEASKYNICIPSQLGS